MEITLSSTSLIMDIFEVENNEKGYAILRVWMYTIRMIFLLKFYKTLIDMMNSLGIWEQHHNSIGGLCGRQDDIKWQTSQSGAKITKCSTCP